MFAISLAWMMSEDAAAFACCRQQVQLHGRTTHRESETMAAWRDAISVVSRLLAAESRRLWRLS